MCRLLQVPSSMVAATPRAASSKLRAASMPKPSSIHGIRSSAKGQVQHLRQWVLRGYVHVVPQLACSKYIWESVLIVVANELFVFFSVQGLVFCSR
jgi:hypothetical protein